MLYLHWWCTLFNKNSGNVTFSSDGMGIFSVDLNNINLDDANFHENDLKTIIHVRPLAWHNKFEKRKAFKKNIKKELIPVACHPTR